MRAVLSQVLSVLFEKAIRMGLRDEQWGVIVNPYSGKRELRKDWARIYRMLKFAEIRFCEQMTAYPGHAVEIARSLVDTGVRHILVVGGDGTMNEVVNGVFSSSLVDKSSVSIALIPYGTGNDWARFWGLADKRHDLSARLIERRKVMVDVGRLRYSHDGKECNRYFINDASVGLSATVVKTTNRLKKYLGGHSWVYTLSLLLSVCLYRSVRMKVVADNSAIEKEMFTVTVGNGCYTGGGFKQTPAAVPYDGLFDINAIERPTFMSIIKGLGFLFRGDIDKHPCSNNYVAKRARIESSTALLAETDGIMLPECTEYDIEIIPSAIGMYV